MVVRKGMPGFNEFVICTVRKISPFAAWCTLEEYPELEGMIHISEVAGKWVRDIRNFVKQDKQYVAKVVRVDRERNSVNLSLKRVSKRDEKDKLNEYRKEQRAEKILEQAGKELKKNLDQTYDEIGFLLQEKFGELFVALEEIKKEPGLLDKLGVKEEWKNVLLKIIEKAFVEKEVALKAEVELRSYASDGIERIKNLLKELEKDSKAEVRYISAPKYRIEIKTKNPKVDEKNLRQHLDKLVSESKQLEVEAGYRFVK